LWYNIATIFLEIGEDEEAMKYYRETLRVERLALGHDHHDVVLTLQHMGHVHQQRGDLDEALSYYREALVIERKKKGDDDVAVAKVLNLIGNIHMQRAEIKEVMVCYSEATRIYMKCGQPVENLVIGGYNFYALSKLHPECAPIA
jgi:tetratricopeptide (TPR) repeat protein